ncbi:MAG TPA: c-type cytochrome [Polyangiales bacterium]|nr:c-type cytochrome [Polyangiales bacterium]
MRGLTAALLIAAISCGSDEPAGDVLALARRFSGEPAFRREALEHSLAVRNNDYARLRLAHYARDWDALPEWNPTVAPLSEPNAALESIWDGVPSASVGELLALGREAFERWPAQRLPPLSAALGDPPDAERARSYGLQLNASMRVRYPDGSEQAALSCAGCHAREEPGAASDLDLAALLGASRGPDAELEPEWGPGRLDVTADARVDPVAIPDLRALRHQRRLHWTGNLHNSLPALAVRIETLLITATSATVRPPREIAFALALYVHGLGAAERSPSASQSGAAVFERKCAGCHMDASGAGDLVPADVVGTDPEAAASEERGSGGYRVPSLYRVADRTRLTHEGRFDNLEQMFDPARAVGAHPFGLELSDAERDALLEFVRGF